MSRRRHILKKHFQKNEPVLGLDGDEKESRGEKLSSEASRHKCTPCSELRTRGERLEP
jgi:hypothetical protein